MAQRRKKQAAPAISSKGAELPLDLFGAGSGGKSPIGFSYQRTSRHWPHLNPVRW